MRSAAACMVLMLTACASSGSSLATAIAVHNSTKRIVETADRIVKPIYQAKVDAADAQYPYDDVAFAREMAPLNEVKSLLERAKQVEQSMHLGISQWQAGADDGVMVKESAACGSAVLGELGKVVVSFPGSEFFYMAAAALQDQLTLLAESVPCPVGKSGPLVEVVP